MKNSQQIWEYSIPNIVKYEKLVDPKLIYYAPIPYYKYVNNSEIAEKATYDLFFYGAYNERRNGILTMLKEKYNIKISHNIVGKELEDAIKQSKIIINLHYYEDAVLETTRLNEVLQHNKLVISEKSISADNYNMNMYNDCVVFFDVINNNLDNMDQLYDTIDYWLNDDVYNEKIKSIQENSINLQKKAIFHIHKCIASLGLVKNDMIYDISSEDINCLHLIETPYRINAFMKQEYVPKHKIYPAVKDKIGWLGCGKSYQNIIRNAMRCNLGSVTVCEDDCMFKPDFDNKYEIIKSFLEHYTSGWDIFVGCVAGLPSDTIFKKLIKYKGLTFIEVDQMHSMVFNIYNKTSFEIISRWDPNNKCLETNTIDQYIKRKKLRIILLYPFEFRCLNVKSTLWNNESTNIYQEYEKQFDYSSELINSKINKSTSPDNRLTNIHKDHRKMFDDSSELINNKIDKSTSPDNRLTNIHKDHRKKFDDSSELINSKIYKSTSPDNRLTNIHKDHRKKFDDSYELINSKINKSNINIIKTVNSTNKDIINIKPIRKTQHPTRHIKNIKHDNRIDVRNKMKRKSNVRYRPSINSNNFDVNKYSGSRNIFSVNLIRELL
jgi:hypothetical protein